VPSADGEGGGGQDHGAAVHVVPPRDLPRESHGSGALVYGLLQAARKGGRASAPIHARWCPQDFACPRIQQEC
jgi:hypothetical protein